MFLEIRDIQEVLRLRETVKDRGSEGPGSGYREGGILRACWARPAPANPRS